MPFSRYQRVDLAESDPISGADQNPAATAQGTGGRDCVASRAPEAEALAKVKGTSRCERMAGGPSNWEKLAKGLSYPSLASRGRDTVGG